MDDLGKRAVQQLWPSTNRFSTEFGEKTALGLAEAISDLTGANRLAASLLSMTENLLESHADDLESHHAGDTEEIGEAPHACSYCKDIQVARKLLGELGVDVSTITQQEEDDQ